MPDKFKTSPEEQAAIHEEVVTERPVEILEYEHADGSPQALVVHDEIANLTIVHEYNTGMTYLEDPTTTQE